MFTRINQRPGVGWIVLGCLISLVLFLSTLQTVVNGSDSAYATDIGEIQNALPRWGTLHFPGYPLYSLTGSLAVSALRLLGVQPAAGSSLVSAVWGVATIGLLILAQRLAYVPPLTSVLTALLYAVSTSFWIDASVAEVHTLTVALALASFWLAIRFGRSGRRADLVALALVSTQAVFHQRALVFLGPGLLLLALQQPTALRQGLGQAVLAAAAGALIYLYLPLRAWMGATWTFSQPGTWQGFWSLLLDTKTERILALPASLGEWLARARDVAGLLSNEWPLWLMLAGWAGTLWYGVRRRLESAALVLLWLPFPILSLTIWVGSVGDALLAVNLPAVALAAIGLGCLVRAACARWRPVGPLANLFLIGMLGLMFLQHRPLVLTVTRDLGAQRRIALAEEIEAPPAGRPLTLMALWGNDYWALAYAQAYLNRLPGLRLVDHNADAGAIMASNARLLTLDQTFYERPLSWWQERFGRIYLSALAPHVVELDTQPSWGPQDVSLGNPFELGNGVEIHQPTLAWEGQRLRLELFWRAALDHLPDQSVAVHLVRANPPAGPQDIVSQADQRHPVAGWYPTSGWTAGEIVRDAYYLDASAAPAEAWVRLTMYEQTAGGNFKNHAWLTLPVPERATQAAQKPN
ncbi:MAG: protein O-mannosyl-transferase family [Candidatus Promineifilaceae bacterium]